MYLLFLPNSLTEGIVYYPFQMGMRNQLLVISFFFSGCLAQLKLPADVELTLFSPMVSSSSLVSSNLVGQFPSC